MPRSRSLKIGLALAVGLAGMSAGVTYAATSTSSKVVYACASQTGALGLLSKGKCAKGYGKVAINKQGPRGLPGPGALTLTVASATNRVSANKALALSPLMLDVGVYCEPGTNAALSVGFDPATTPGDWKLSGMTYTNAPSIGLSVNGVSYLGANGSWGFDKTVVGTSGNTARLSVPNGYRVQGSLLLVRGNHSATVDLALDAVASDSCSARAQVTPSG